MRGLITAAPIAQHDFRDIASAHELARTASPNVSASIIARLAAGGLVLASAGFGCAYAWTAGSHHALTIAGVPVLAILAVLMALSLEIAKPFAIANAFAAFRDWRPGQGALLAMLGLIAVAYSLTAELSLMATLRSDNTAIRQAAVKAAAGDDAATERHNERYEAAKRELVNLPATRAAGEIQAEISGHLQTPGVNGCTTIDGPVTQRICPKVAAARAELARAQRRGELDAIMAMPINPPAARAVTTEAVTVADPGATALSTYLAALGLIVRPDAVSQWLVLVPVLALEFGSALAGILAGVVYGHAATGARQPNTTTRRSRVFGMVIEPALPTTDATAATSGATTLETAATTNDGGAVLAGAATGATSFTTIPYAPVRAAGRDEAAGRLLSLLRDQGGRVDASRRALAKMIEATPSTVYGAIADLTATGRIVSEASATGTTIRLTA